MQSLPIPAIVASSPSMENWHLAHLSLYHLHTHRSRVHEAPTIAPSITDIPQRVPQTRRTDKDTEAQKRDRAYPRVHEQM